MMVIQTVIQKEKLTVKPKVKRTAMHWDLNWVKR